ELFESLATRPSIQLIAVHVHVGSQVTSLEPLRRAAVCAGALSQDLKARGLPLEYVDLGGGLGVSYDGSGVPGAAAYVETLVDAVGRTGLPFVIEPGRSMIAGAGVLVARVVDLKPRTATSEFAIIDAGMTELLRPALYGAYHRIEPLSVRRMPARMYEIAGPV